MGQLHALMLEEPAGEVAPEGQALQELPFRYVLMAHGTQAEMLVEPAGEVAPEEHALQESPFR